MELSSRVASIFYHAKLAIDIILLVNIIYLLYTYIFVYRIYIFFCLFLAAPVVMNRQEISVLLIRQVETGRFTIGSVGVFPNAPALE